MTHGTYIEQRFSDAQTAKLEETAGPSNQVFDFLADDEFEFLRYISLDPNTTYPEVGKVSKYWGFGPNYRPANMIHPWLYPRIQQLLGEDVKVDFYAFQEAIVPWKIHADIRWEETKVPYKVMLIPLDVEPVSGPVDVNSWPQTATITFHQRDFLRKYPEKSNKQIIPNTGQDHWQRPIDNPCFERLEEGYQIDREVWDSLLSHVPYDHAEGLTLDRVNYWVPKSIMYWDNTALHAADDFLAHGIRTKRCFMIFTYL